MKVLKKLSAEKKVDPLRSIVTVPSSSVTFHSYVLYNYVAKFLLLIVQLIFNLKNIIHRRFSHHRFSYALLSRIVQCNIGVFYQNLLIMESLLARSAFVKAKRWTSSGISLRFLPASRALSACERN